MLRVYGMGEKLLKAVYSFYVDSRACVWVGMDVSEWLWDVSMVVYCIHGWCGESGEW